MNKHGAAALARMCSWSTSAPSMRARARGRAGRGTSAAHLADEGVAAVGAHALGAEVGVAARAVPVAGDGLRIEGDRDPVVLAHLERERERERGAEQVITGAEKSK